MQNHVGQPIFQFEHTIGDRVMVDQDPALTFIVTGIQIYPEGIVFKLSWFDDNGPKEQVFDAFRIAAHPRPRPGR